MLDAQKAFYEGDIAAVEATNLFVLNLKGKVIHAA